jgi:hypothetical protein
MSHFETMKYTEARKSNGAEVISQGAVFKKAVCNSGNERNVAAIEIQRVRTTPNLNIAARAANVDNFALDVGIGARHYLDSISRFNVGLKRSERLVNDAGFVETLVNETNNFRREFRWQVTQIVDHWFNS